MASPRKRPVKKDIPKKKCMGQCGKEKSYTFFYKVNSPLFPDGMLNICRDCIRDQIDIEDIEQVIAFLRQIDKPFIESYWEEAKKSKNYPLGEYIRKVNSLQQVKNKDFNSSDNISEVGKIDLEKAPEFVETESGIIINYDESLVSKWGAGYKKFEYLKLQKFYQDMMDSYDIQTANHKQMLIQLAKLTVEMDNLLAVKDYGNYKKVSDAYDALLKSSGFRPIDRKNGADSFGIFSFSQVWAEIEREGFIKPKMIEYEKDDIDYMLLYYIQFVQRLVGQTVSTEPPENWREEIEQILDNEPIDDVIHDDE